MFKTAKDVDNASNTEIVEIVQEGWNAGLGSILTDEDFDIVKKAKQIEEEAEAIAYAIRRRFDEMIDEEIFDEDYDGDPQEDIDEFMTAIAQEVGQQYIDNYSGGRADSFWIPSSCY